MPRGVGTTPFVTASSIPNGIQTNASRMLHLIWALHYIPVAGVTSVIESRRRLNGRIGHMRVTGMGPRVLFGPTGHVKIWPMPGRTRLGEQWFQRLGGAAASIFRPTFRTSGAPVLNQNFLHPPLPSAYHVGQRVVGRPEPRDDVNATPATASYRGGVIPRGWDNLRSSHQPPSPDRPRPRRATPCGQGARRAVVIRRAAATHRPPARASGRQNQQFPSDVGPPFEPHQAHISSGGHPASKQEAPRPRPCDEFLVPCRWPARSAPRRRQNPGKRLARPRSVEYGVPPSLFAVDGPAVGCAPRSGRDGRAGGVWTGWTGKTGGKGGEGGGARRAWVVGRPTAPRGLLSPTLHTLAAMDPGPRMSATLPCPRGGLLVGALPGAVAAGRRDGEGRFGCVLATAALGPTTRPPPANLSLDVPTTCRACECANIGYRGGCSLRRTRLPSQTCNATRPSSRHASRRWARQTRPPGLTTADTGRPSDTGAYIAGQALNHKALVSPAKWRATNGRARPPNLAAVDIRCSFSDDAPLGSPLASRIPSPLAHRSTALAVVDLSQIDVVSLGRSFVAEFLMTVSCVNRCLYWFDLASSFLSPRSSRALWAPYYPRPFSSSPFPVLDNTCHCRFRGIAMPTSARHSCLRWTLLPSAEQSSSAERAWFLASIPRPAF